MHQRIGIVPQWLQFSTDGTENCFDTVCRPSYNQSNLDKQDIRKVALNKVSENNLPDLTALQESLGLRFRDQDLLFSALLHSSYVNENPDSSLESNERLEFLGDAVLSLVITEELFRIHPGVPEGDLTVMRAEIVSGSHLTQISRNLNIGSYLLLGKGEDRSGGRDRDSNLAAAFESLIGAMFLDRGYRRCHQILSRLLRPSLRSLIGHSPSRDPKSVLQEVLQSTAKELPLYHIVKVAGPDHKRIYTAKVFFRDQILGVGMGSRKALAEREAARDALRNLQEQ